MSANKKQKTKWKNGRSPHIELAYKLCQTHKERKESIKICQDMLFDLQHDSTADYATEILPRSLLVATNAVSMSKEAQIKELNRAIAAQQTLVLIVDYAVDTVTRDIERKYNKDIAEQFKSAMWSKIGSVNKDSVKVLNLPPEIGIKTFKKSRYLIAKIILSAFGGMPYTRDFYSYREK